MKRILLIIAFLLILNNLNANSLENTHILKAYRGILQDMMYEIQKDSKEYKTSLKAEIIIDKNTGQMEYKILEKSSIEEFNKEVESFLKKKTKQGFPIIKGTNSNIQKEDKIAAPVIFYPKTEKEPIDKKIYKVE